MYHSEGCKSLSLSIVLLAIHDYLILEELGYVLDGKILHVPKSKILGNYTRRYKIVELIEYLSDKELLSYYLELANIEMPMDALQRNILAPKTKETRNAIKERLLSYLEKSPLVNMANAPL